MCIRHCCGIEHIHYWTECSSQRRWDQCQGGEIGKCSLGCYCSCRGLDGFVKADRVTFFWDVTDAHTVSCTLHAAPRLSIPNSSGIDIIILDTAFRHPFTFYPLCAYAYVLTSGVLPNLPNITTFRCFLGLNQYSMTGFLGPASDSTSTRYDHGFSYPSVRYALAPC